MSGYVLAITPCLTCGAIFTCNPHLVPSVRWPQPDGPRQPVCEACVRGANAERVKMGLAPHEIEPGAYEAGPA